MRVAGFVAIAAALVAGVFVLGRLAPDDRDAMALTAAWFAVVGATAFLLVRRRRDLLVPLAAGYAAVAVTVTVLLGLPMFVDKRVNERVAVASPRSGNVELASGSFEGVRHAGSGNAAVVRLRGGERVLTLTDFETDNGPDLFVYLAAGNPTDEDGVDEYVDLGRLKGNIGNQQYEIPAGTDIRRYSTVVIWCRAFSVLFARAGLAPS